MDARQKDLVFPRCKFIQQGFQRVDPYIDSMRNAILTKDGIVPPKQK
jgi:hypothetical protein